MLLILTCHVNWRKQEDQVHRDTITRRHENDMDLLAKNALVLHGNGFTAWTGTRIHKMPFSSLVFESCLRIIVDLKSAIGIGEGKEISNDVLCHDISFLIFLLSTLQEMLF